MEPIILEVDVVQRANGQRVARLLREMQCVCQMDRRRLGAQLFQGQGRERRLADRPSSMGARRRQV